MNRQIDVNSGRCKIQGYLGVETERGGKLSQGRHLARCSPSLNVGKIGPSPKSRLQTVNPGFCITEPPSPILDSCHLPGLP